MVQQKSLYKYRYKNDFKSIIAVVTAVTRGEQGQGYSPPPQTFLYN